MKKFIILLFLSIPCFSQDEIKKPINDFFRIVSASTKTLDDSGLKDVLTPNHTFINDLEFQTVYAYTKYLINQSVNLTLLSQVDKFGHIEVFNKVAYVVVAGTDKIRYKNKESSNRFMASFVLVYDDKTKKWLINNIHSTNEK